MSSGGGDAFVEPPRQRLARAWCAAARRKACACLGLGLVGVLAATMTACATGGRGSAAPRVALVIGNAAYENAPALVNPINDAADMCAALKTLDFRTQCATNLRDRAEFERLVQGYVAQLAQAGPTAVGVFYYSGHGVQAANANYLIPTRAEPQAAAENPLRVLYGVDELFAKLRGGKPVRFQLVVLDACRNDLFGDSPGRSVGQDARSALLRSLQSTARAAAGLAPVNDAPEGTMVLYATASKEAAFDGEGRNGPLTRHVLEHIGTRGLVVEEFFKRVTAGVQTETLRDYRKRQTPFIYGSFTGRFCFAGCPGEADVPPAF
jgi:uncharacterized caspase-like protein